MSSPLSSVSEKPLLTSIVIPFTREWVVDDFLAMFEKIDFGLKTAIELIFYNDSDNIKLQEKLLKWITVNGDAFGAHKIYMSGNPLLPEAGDGHNVTMRRERIVEMKRNTAKLVGNSFFVFCLEDDTFVAPDTYKKLLRHIQKPNVGLASGVELGRWAYSVIGAWSITPLEDPETVETIPYCKSGIQEVSATGWYCYITKTNLYKKAEYRFEAECFGPDVCYGWDVSRSGREVLVDWSIVCEHRQVNGDSLYPNSRALVVSYFKDKYNHWIATFKTDVH